MKNKRFLIIFIIIAISFIVVGFGIAHIFQKPIVIEKSVDTSKFDHIIDSVMLENKQIQFVINEQVVLIDSLKKSLKNKEQHAIETKQIKEFTNSTRNRWNDSTLRANGRR